MVLGTPGSKRVRLFEAAAGKSIEQRVTVVGYDEWLQGKVDLTWANGARTLVRIDSPGESWPVWQKCLELGVDEANDAGLEVVKPPSPSRVPPTRGRIIQPAQWFFGFRRLLERLRTSLPDVRWMTSPSTVARMFDKVAVEDDWAARQLPVPTRFATPRSFDDVRELLILHDRVILKHRYGYSATGAVALHRQRAGLRALTATQLDDGKLYLTKRLQVLRAERDIAQLVDRLCGQSLIAQQWIPKAKLIGRNFDLRIVAVDRRAAHIVGRSSGSPFTNLNLDAGRLSAAVLTRSLTQRFGDAFRQRLQELVSASAASFLDALYCGLDVLVRPDGQLVLLEANAFGDYLPRLTWEDKSTHEAELESLICRGLVEPKVKTTEFAGT